MDLDHMFIHVRNMRHSKLIEHYIIFQYILHTHTPISQIVSSNLKLPSLEVSLQEVKRFKRSGLSMTQHQIILFLVMCSSHGLKILTVASCSGGGSMCATIKQHQTSKETRSVCSIHKAIFQGQGHHDTHGSYAAPQRLKGKTERRMQDRGVIYLHLPAACYCTCWWK